MKLTVINHQSGVIVHKAGCADVKKDLRPRGEFENDSYTFEYASKTEAFLDYNGDFLAEESGAHPMDFKPCTKVLPDDVDTDPSYADMSQFTYDSLKAEGLA